MTNVSSNAVAAKPDSAIETEQVVFKEIRAKWDKFSEQDMTALKSKDELVSQVVAKYGLDKAQALRDVDALLKGRQI